MGINHKIMGIEEGIKEDIREHAEPLIIVRIILKHLEKNILTFLEIAEVFEVKLEFVERVQAGEIYINEYEEVIDKDDPVWD